jgi:hypothetical protein
VIEVLTLAQARARVARFPGCTLISGLRMNNEVREQRDAWYRDAFAGCAVSVSPIGPGGGSRYRLSSSPIVDGNSRQPRELACDWRDFTEHLRVLLPDDADVLLDMSAFAFDSLIYLLRALDDLGHRQFRYCYAAPEHYDDDPILDAQHDIQQPKGYAELIDPEKRRAKLFLLGFDDLRADRFVDTYDWADDDLHFCVADPGTVDNSAQRSHDALSERLRAVFDRNPRRAFRLRATDPHAAEDLILRMVEQHGRLDLMPLGPKPWTFAAASAYLKLRRGKAQGRADSPIRILYDYGQRKQNRTTGVSQVVFGSWSLDP